MVDLEILLLSLVEFWCSNTWVPTKDLVYQPWWPLPIHLELVDTIEKYRFLPALSLVQLQLLYEVSFPLLVR